MKFPSYKLALSFCVLISTSVYAQQENVDTAVFNQIKKAELQSSQIPKIAYYLTDVSGPRLTNSPGFKRAGDWAIKTLKSWGLVNVGYEPWGNFGEQWELQDFSITMRQPYPQPLRTYAEPWSISTNGTIQGEVVVMPMRLLLDSTYIIKHSAALKNKFILFIQGNLPGDGEKFKPAAARLSETELANLQDADMKTKKEVDARKELIKTQAKIDKLLKHIGALGLITAYSKSVDGTIFVHSQGGYNKPHNEVIPKIDIAVEDAERIKRLTESGRRVEIAVNIVARSSTQDTKGYNVIAEIPGTDAKLKSQLVMLGGHLDSWSAATGATDNAAGCAVAMEAVRLLDSLHLRPKRTIRIAMWSGEEEYLLGSYNYVKNHFMDSRDHKLKPEQGKVSAYFNLDNGTGKIRGIYAQNDTAIKPIFDKWLKPFNDLGATTVTIKNTGSTDHISFDWAGIPGFEFLQDPIDYESRTHHSNMDDYDHLEINDLKQAAIIVASFIYQASTRPAMLPRKPLKKETFIFDGL